MDRIDEKILKELRFNARISNAELSEMVGLSESACWRRTKALERLGIIRGYAAIISNPNEHNATLTFINIQIERRTKEQYAKFEKAISGCPYVIACYATTGTFDYLLIVDAKSFEEYEMICSRYLLGIPGLANITSFYTLRTVIAPKAT